MMITRKMAAFLAGALIGGAIGYFIGEMVAYQIRKNMEYSEEDHEEAHFGVVEDTVLTPNEMRENLGLQPVIKANDIPKEKKHKKVNYNRLSEKGKLDELVKQYKLEPEDETADIHVISEEDFAIDMGHEKIPLSYYEDDDTLADEKEAIVHDTDKLIGDSLIKFGKLSNDPDIVYVRNNKRNCDYEVTRIHGSYQIVVLGMSSESVDKKNIKKPKKKAAPDDDESS